MGDDELNELRRRRMEDLQRQQQQQGAMEEEMARQQQQQEAQIHMILMQILEPEARERLNTIKLTRPDFAKAVEQQLVILAQSGRLRGKISDEMLKNLLTQLMPQKKDYKITRK
ncbi:DNA-binding protein [Methanogenium organophilum]|uniref:DNA-binding protein OU421_09835 n=1 Tax=Methanogenium organophilum TaxID=2199 RepID=A0A9X9S2V6_METOG|nr:DNA-binding protein [Methanogenium organophilum]WAI00721.1 DNA-binding protein [Methanogenium organophilum]